VGRLVDRPGSDWREEQPLHTDGGDVLALLCLRPAARGGLTRLTSARAAYERLAAQCPRSVALLEDEWRFSRKGRPGPPTLTKRIFEWVDGELHAFHLPGTVRWTPRVHGLPPLTPDAARALDDLDCVLNSAALRFELKLEAGDLLVLDNRVVLHARSAYEDDSSHGPRFLLRMWWTVDRRAIRGESHTRG
jgi:alpha-ketoglutarate-dependent taurine dioxygenase